MPKAPRTQAAPETLMSAPKTPATTSPAEGGEAPKKASKKKLILIVAPVLLLVALVAGLWFTGVLPKLLHGKSDAPAAALADENGPPVYVEVPEIITNLNAGPRRTAFVKIKISIELARAADQKAVTDAMPQIEDLFQTYLREMHPDELSGSIGSYRLREEFIARISIAAAPVRVRDVLFTELFTQ